MYGVFFENIFEKLQRRHQNNGSDIFIIVAFNVPKTKRFPLASSTVLATKLSKLLVSIRSLSMVCFQNFGGSIAYLQTQFFTSVASE
jgi:hypothetical protein